jgi:NAD-dependent deacetylase
MDVKLNPGDSIVILTGAGISKESGLDTFRDTGGAWAKYDMEKVCTPQGFARYTDLSHEFYNGRRQMLTEVEPNAAHKALARLEQAWPGPVLVVTQNIDDLHERGGSSNLIHMHGELLSAFCQHCGHHLRVTGTLSKADACPSCGRAAGLRPDIVFFGEMPYQMERIMEALAECRLFISIGTSGNVYPAAGFVAEAAANGATTVELNLEPSLGASMFDEAIQGPATDLVPTFVDNLLARIAH